MDEKDKEKIMYEAYASNWFGSIMEFDKQLLWLSAGGIAILLNKGVELALSFKTGLFFTALFFLSLTIISVLRVYKLNRDILGALMQENENERSIANNKIKSWDIATLIFVAIGMLSLVVYFIIEKGNTL